MPVKALIFDVDGTLAETEEAHRRAFNEAFAAAGLDWRWSRERYGALLRVTGGKERIAHHARASGVRLPAQGARSIAALHARKSVIYNVLVRSGEVGLRPGVSGLLGAARAAGLPLAIATTTSLENIETLVEVTLGCPLHEVFEFVCAGDMVGAKKPAPDVYLMALGALGVAARDALAFEDSAVGLRAALDAGLPTVITPSMYTRNDDFSGALCVLADLTVLARTPMPYDLAELRTDGAGRRRDAAAVEDMAVPMIVTDTER